MSLNVALGAHDALLEMEDKMSWSSLVVRWEMTRGLGLRARALVLSDLLRLVVRGLVAEVRTRCSLVLGAVIAEARGRCSRVWRCVYRLRAVSQEEWPYCFCLSYDVLWALARVLNLPPKVLQDWWAMAAAWEPGKSPQTWGVGLVVLGETRLLITDGTSPRIKWFIAEENVKRPAPPLGIIKVARARGCELSEAAQMGGWHFLGDQEIAVVEEPKEPPPAAPSGTMVPLRSDGTGPYFIVPGTS